MFIHLTNFSSRTNMPGLVSEATACVVAFAAWLLLLVGDSGLVSAAPTFNRTIGEVRVSSCEGLKNKVELGLDISIVIEADLLCEAVLTLGSGQEVTIASAYTSIPTEEYTIVIAEAFATPDPSAASLIINPYGARLTLERLKFRNEVGADGSVRAVGNAGTLIVVGCTFVNLNFAFKQDGGAIYSSVDPGSDEGGLVSVRNSTFLGNVARNYGGAIAAKGAGSVSLSNCTFDGNEAVGSGSYRRAGIGGAVYASPGVHVSVLNSSFQGCLGRYGGAALFLCGGVIEDSTFDSNEATGLFGAVVNGDLSEEERQNATSVFGATPPGQNYTCSDLTIAGSRFISNSVTGGFGGAIASVDASLTVYNLSLLEGTGGALYFGTSDDSGRDQLDMGFIIFNFNGGSEFSPDMVGAAFLLELTGSPASNTTGQVVREELSSSTAVQVQSASEGTSTPGSVVVGTGRDLYCFKNDPYECEGYFGDAKIQLTGTQRCSACEGNPFTGIGSADGAITPAPLGFDDDDGLSQMGQERAQGGTPSPAGVGGGAGSGSDVSSSGENGGGGVGGPGSDAVEAGGGGDPELLGVTGPMRWVVLALTVGLVVALLVCMCLLAVCRVSKKRKKTGHERVQAGVEERQLSPVHRAGAGSRSKSAVAPFYSVTSKNQLVALSPSTPAAQAHSGWGNKSASRSISRRGSRSSSDAATPASQRNARQRVMDMSAEADRRAENIFCATRPPTEGREANAKGTPQAEKRRGVTALPGSLPDDSSRATEGEGLFFVGRSAKERGNGSGQTTRSEEYGGREKKYRDGSRSRSLDRSSGHVKSRVSDVSDDVDTQGKITWVPTDLRQAPPFRSKGSARVYSKKSFDSSKTDF